MVFVGANDGSIWTVEIRTLTWKRKLPFQHHLRERLDYPESNKNMNKNGPTSPRAWATPSRNFGPSKEEQQIMALAGRFLPLQLQATMHLL